MLRNCILVLILLASAIAGSACSELARLPVSPTPPLVLPSPPVPPSPPSTPTITITAAGMSPLELTINVGQRVAFVNNDSRPHDVVGGKDPSTPDCPEILQAGFLAPGQRSETGAFTRAQTCEYHDHTMLSVPAFQGRIIIR